MTSQQQADELLEQYWVAKSLLKHCFKFSTQEEFDRVLSRVSEEMSCRETIGLPSPLPLQDRF